MAPQDFLDGEAIPLRKRGITLKTCQKWGYLVGDHKGSKVQIANYRAPDGRLVAQKVRGKDKAFSVRGDLKAAGLYGQHLWAPGGKQVVITEGEIDALSLSTLQGDKWPVVSVPNGAQGARKALAAQSEWLETFGKIILMFDQDGPGREAAEECALLFTPGKAYVATLPLKDPNEMLVAGRGDELLRAMWDAKPYRPDGIVTFQDLDEEIEKEPEQGLSYPWPALTEATFGMRPNELVALGAGTGIGKSDVFKEIAMHLVVQHEQNVGILFLEEHPAHTAKCLMSKYAGKLFHIPGEEWTQEEFQAAKSALAETQRVYMYDHFGATDWEVVQARIRYMAVGLGCKYIFLDHITALVSGDAGNDERKELDAIMTGLASLVRELHINIHFISHLATPEGSPHEEGGRVKVRHFRGSRAIGQWSSFMFGLERDQQQPETPTTFRILKDRYTGRSTGLTFGLRYDLKTGRYSECDLETGADENGVTGTEDF